MATANERTARNASVEGAQSVSEAVKRVADAAVAEIQKTKIAAPGDFIITTKGGKRFSIRGQGFSSSGSVLVGKNGPAAKTTSWGAEEINGVFPDSFTGGDVTVWIDPETQQHGYVEKL